MDFGKLSKITDEIRTGKKSELVVNGRVLDGPNENPLNKIDLKEKIADKQKVIVIDRAFIKKLKDTPRDKRREFLSRLTDSQRKKVLSLLKIKDDTNSELGFITLDTLLANFLYDPSPLNKTNVEDFVKSQSYFEMTVALIALVDAVLADDELPKEGLAELVAGLNGTPSRLEAFSGEVVDFKVPEEEEFTEEDAVLVDDAVKKHLAAFLENHSISKLVDAAEDLLAEFQGRNRSYAQSAKRYWEAMDKAWQEQCAKPDKEVEETIEILRDIVDDNKKLDTIFEGPAYSNGEEVQDVEDRSVINLLVEALEDFADGNSEKLDVLLEQSIAEDVEEPEEEEDVEEIEEETEETEEKVKDAVHKLARRFKQGKSINKLVDALSKVCPKLGSMNLKIEDNEGFVSTLPAEVPQVADIPLTYEEYCANNQDIPAVVACTLGEEKPIVWPFKDWKIEEDCVNCDGRCYKPYACTLEELAARLEEAEDDPTRVEIIGSTSVPVGIFRKVAAKCDALNLIDRRFYRPSTSSKQWKFNGNIQELLGDSIKGTTFTRSLPNDKTINLFGSSYIVE